MHPTNIVNSTDYYSENYADYDRQNSATKLSFYLRLLRRHVEPGAKIFELGVGKGNFLKLAARKYQVTGCDVNADGIRAARAKVPEAKILEGSSETIAADTYDAVVSFDVLEHLPDLSAGLRAIYAGLKADGVLIGVVPVYDGPLGWLVRRLDKDPTHLTKESRIYWLAALRQAGFHVEERGGILRKLVGGRYVHFTRPQGLLWSTGVAIYFVASKPGR